MIQTLKGKATIISNEKKILVDILLDFQVGGCFLSERNQEQNSDFLTLTLFLSEEIYLHSVQVTSNIGILQAEILGPFFFHSRIENDGFDKSFLDSSLFSTQEVPPVEGKILIKPKHSKLCLKLSDQPRTDYSEIFFDCEPDTKIECNIKLDDVDVEISTIKSGLHLYDYIRCASKNDLSHHLEQLHRGLSFFTRRRTFHFFIRTKETVQINLSNPGNKLSYGAILRIEKESNSSNVLEALVSCFNDHNPFFLVEAYSNPGTIEVRCLNALVYLEIIDGSKKLSANQLASALNISRENADALVKFRNFMVHQGLSIQEALTAVQKEISERRGGKKTARIIEEVMLSDCPSGKFYLALMDLLSAYVFSKAGVPVEWMKFKNAPLFHD